MVTAAHLVAERSGAGVDNVALLGIVLGLGGGRRWGASKTLGRRELVGRGAGPTTRPRQFHRSRSQTVCGLGRRCLHSIHMPARRRSRPSSPRSRRSRVGFTLARGAAAKAVARAEAARRDGFRVRRRDATGFACTARRVRVPSTHSDPGNVAQGRTSRPRPRPPPRRTHAMPPAAAPLPLRVFASHDWGANAENHARVAAVVAALRDKGVDVWFDETHMKGNILSAMCRGIDAADVVLVFVTCNYLAKVASGAQDDNVRREFLYMADTCPERMLPIRFDAALPRKWGGPVGMVLGTQLYVDLAAEGAGDAEGVARLLGAIRHKSPRTLWKAAYTRAHRAAPCLPPPRPAQGAAAKEPAAARRPPPPPPVDRGGGLRARVAHAFEVTGDRMPDDVHVHAAVDVLLRSVTGSVVAQQPLPFHAKLARLEHELGIATDA